MIAKVLDSDTSLATKIQMLFRKQDIMITYVLMAIGMAIDILLEALLPGGGGVVAQDKGGGKPENMKEWLRNKLKALALLLGRLGVKTAKAFPGIIGVIISWILDRAKEVLSLISLNLWALVTGVG